VGRPVLALRAVLADTAPPLDGALFALDEWSDAGEMFVVLAVGRTVVGVGWRPVGVCRAPDLADRVSFDRVWWTRWKRTARGMAVSCSSLTAEPSTRLTRSRSGSGTTSCRTACNLFEERVQAKQYLGVEGGVGHLALGERSPGPVPGLLPLIELHVEFTRADFAKAVALQIMKGQR
jgi:hypothetical protein